MALSLNNLKPSPGAYRHRKRRGRGNASGHGTYSGRGIKGQKARTGGRNKLKIKGMKRMIQQIPKRKGFRSLQNKPAVVNLKGLEKHFEAGAVVSPQSLQEKGLIGNIKGGVKILGKGELSKKLIVRDCLLSKSAAEAVKKVGGEIS